MRIFTAFIVIMASVILFLLPLTQAQYDFKTDQRTDSIGALTAVGVTSANITLGQAIFEDDTTTVTVLSDLTTELPVFMGATYSGLNFSANVSGLTANASRTFTVTYDVDALSGWAGIVALVDRLAWIWLLLIIAFPAAAVAAIFMRRL